VAQLFIIMTLCVLVATGCSQTDNTSDTSNSSEKQEITTTSTEEPKQETNKEDTSNNDTSSPATSKQSSTTTNQQQESKSSTSDKETKSEYPHFKAEVVRVVDGDTLKIKFNEKEETVRLLLVDTPESVHPSKPVQPYGVEASNFAKKKLTGKTVDVELGIGERDKYGRLLAYIYVDGKMFNETLLETGYARVAYVYGSNTRYVDEFRAIQDKARKKEIGIWSIENYADNDFKTESTPKKSSTPAPAPSPSSTLKSDTSTSTGKCNIKGNISSSGEKIYHVRGGQFYDVTQAEEMFCSTQEAENAGYRASMR